MKDPFLVICEKVGIAVIGEEMAKKAVLEILPCIGLKERDAVRAPNYTASEITSYLDELVKNP